MAYILALDQGTTSSRAILFDHEGTIRAVAQREFEQIFPQPGWVEHDPEEIWTSQISVAVEALSRAQLAAKDVAAVGITNQRETAIVWDRETGKPVYNAIVWQDRRTAGFCDKLKAGGQSRFIQQRTGLLIDSYFSASKIVWILENVPGARDRAKAGKLAFGTVDSWLLWKLTNGNLHATDISNASRTMLFNIHTANWDDELLRLFGIPASMMPEVRSCSEIYADITSSLGLGGLPVAGIAGDQQASLFGQRCIAPGLAKNTYGTGCFLLQNTGTQAVASRNQLVTTVAWKIGSATEYALEGSVFVGGAVVQWLRDGLALIRTSEEVEPLAASVADNGGVYFVPAFVGLGAPHWDQYARGSLFGITRGTKAGHIARAALESIAYQVADLLDAMQADAGTPLQELRVDGGACRNDKLMQFQSDIIGIPVVRPAVTETTALGAAYLAGLSTGVWRRRESYRGHPTKRNPFRTTYPPVPGQRAAAALERSGFTLQSLGGCARAMNRDAMLQRAFTRTEPWDILIVGGGATGMGAAVDAAARGYEVLLLEQSDFGKGTSSRSTKLVHGGVRYLEQGNISLVMEALRERGILRQNAPHLVSDLAFVVPRYDWWEAPFYGIGLKIYDLLAGEYGFGKSQLLSREETLARLPTIKREGLRGGVVYYDGQFDDSRLLINLAQTAAEHGATLLNYFPVTGLVKATDGFVAGVEARDSESGKSLRALAKVVVNATGPFSDHLRRMADSSVTSMIQPSQGIHLVFDRSFLAGDSAIMVPHTRDGRVMFAIPWNGHTVVGTTDTPISAPSLEPRPLAEEVDFILETAGKYLDRPPERHDVLSVFAGIRPLVNSGNANNTAELSRDHTIRIENSGLLTIAGGKWTTYRRMAEDCINQAATLARLPEIGCPTVHLNIHGSRSESSNLESLGAYGTDAIAIRRLIDKDARMGEPLHAGLPYCGAEVVWAARDEMARSVEDVLARRTRCIVSQCAGSFGDGFAGCRPDGAGARPHCHLGSGAGRQLSRAGAPVHHRIMRISDC